jgi:hypothetical protein
MMMMMMMMMMQRGGGSLVGKYAGELMDEPCDNGQQLRMRGVEGDAPVLIFRYVHWTS